MGTEPIKLTEVELEMMKVLWDLQEGTVRDVLGLLDPRRDLAYTSVSTILRILEQKKVVESRKSGRAHVYRPLFTRAEYEAKSVHHLVDNVFEGTPCSLVRCLVNTESLSDEEWEELQKIVAARNPMGR